MESMPHPKNTASVGNILLGGVALAGALLFGRMGLRVLQGPRGFSTLPRGLRNAPKGGFDDKMTRYEAAQIVGLKTDRNITRAKLAEKYKNVMLANHPDRGGSPYLALKINEARRVLAPFAR